MINPLSAYLRSVLLLYRSLTGGQFVRWLLLRSVLVASPGEPNRWYRVSASRVGVFEDGKYEGNLCAVPKRGAWMPGPDRVLAKKLWIEADEQGFLNTAIRTDRRVGRVTLFVSLVSFAWLVFAFGGWRLIAYAARFMPLAGIAEVSVLALRALPLILLGIVIFAVIQIIRSVVGAFRDLGGAPE